MYPQRKSSGAAKRDGTDRLFNAIAAEFAHTRTVRALVQAAVAYKPAIDRMPRRWAEFLREEYASRLQDLRAEEIRHDRR
jgi:hypothetical protein